MQSQIIITKSTFSLFLINFRKLCVKISSKTQPSPLQLNRVKAQVDRRLKNIPINSETFDLRNHFDCKYIFKSNHCL